MLAQQQRGLIAERAAAVESSHIALARTGARFGDRREGKLDIVWLQAGRKRDCDDRRILERLRYMKIGRREYLRIGAEKIDHNWFSGPARPFEYADCHLRRGRLRDQDDHAGTRIAGKRIEALLHGERADLCMEIAPAGSDSLAH